MPKQECPQQENRCFSFAFGSRAAFEQTNELNFGDPNPEYIAVK